MIKLLLGVAVALTTSCQYGVKDIARVPDQPTFTHDVYALFHDHCLVCHGAPPNRGAPGYFRLDVYDDSGGVLGAKTMAAPVLGNVRAGTMPPAARDGDGVGPNGLAMLQKWVDNGAPR
jgi:mono/diheme cytochrome c family protein